MMVIRKLDGALDESSVDQEIRISDTTVHSYSVKNLKACTYRNPFLRQAGWLAGSLADEI